MAMASGITATSYCRTVFRDMASGDLILVGGESCQDFGLSR